VVDSCMRYNEHTHATTNNRYALLKDKQCIQQITRPKIGKKNASQRATPSLSIVHNYVSAFTTNKPDSTPGTVIHSLGVVAVFRHAQDIVHSFARSKLPRQNMMNDVRIFSCVLVLGNSMRIDDVH